jgi:hypothetical protein
MTYQYHDALDWYEARIRAELAERALDEADACMIAIAKMMAQLQEEYDEIQRGKAEMARRFAEGTDTSAKAQLNEAGYGEGGVL